ncbi:hypothetical protein LCGC14_0451170 [marine sediment metagenome]|uniref:Uncharacterized protein n=1 Tax=marine sediment metagenome TaxID=412755 RepID=A0A0F9V4M8_9ZZZZ
MDEDKANFVCLMCGEPFKKSFVKLIDEHMGSLNSVSPCCATNYVAAWAYCLVVPFESMQPVSEGEGT